MVTISVPTYTGRDRLSETREEANNVPENTVDRMEDSPQFVFSAMRETEASVRFIHKGLDAFAETYERGGDEFMAPLLLITQGLERLMKTVWIVYQRDKDELTEEAPKTLQYDFSHDLDKLRQWIVSNCYTDDYLSRPAAEDDLEFLSTDRRTLKLFQVLTEFADSGGRYYHLDRMLGQEPESENPHRAWEAFEDYLLKGAEFQDHGNLGDNWEAEDLYLRDRTVEIVSRITRALCRLFTLEPLGESGKQVSGELSDYLLQRDDELSSLQEANRG